MAFTAPAGSVCMLKESASSVNPVHPVPPVATVSDGALHAQDAAEVPSEHCGVLPKHWHTPEHVPDGVYVYPEPEDVTVTVSMLPELCVNVAEKPGLFVVCISTCVRVECVRCLCGYVCVCVCVC